LTRAHEDAKSMIKGRHDIKSKKRHYGRVKVQTGQQFKTQDPEEQASGHDAISMSNSTSASKCLKKAACKEHAWTTECLRMGTSDNRIPLKESFEVNKWFVTSVGKL